MKEVAWQFETAQWRVSLILKPEECYEYDGDDDEDGETQRQLNEGALVAFQASVHVTHRPTGKELGADYLGGCVYEAGNVSDFWTNHRDPNPLHRNSSIMRKAKGDNVVICHYFPSMVVEAIHEARRNASLLSHSGLREEARS